MQPGEEFKIIPLGNIGPIASLPTKELTSCKSCTISVTRSHTRLSKSQRLYPIVLLHTCVVIDGGKTSDEVDPNDIENNYGVGSANQSCIKNEGHTKRS